MNLDTAQPRAGTWAEGRYSEPPALLTRSGDSTAPGTPPARSSAPIASPATALTISAVYRAVQIQCSTVCQLPLQEMRGSAVVTTSLLLRQPELNCSLLATLKKTVTSLLLHGNAFWRLFKDDAGKVTNFEVLNPQLIVPLLDPKTGALRYSYSGYLGKVVDLAEADVKHLKMLESPGRFPGNLLALGPIQAARAEIQGILDLRNYADSWFGDDEQAGAGVANGVLKSDQALTPTDADNYRDAWLEAQRGHTIAVLGKGLDYSPTLLNPADALFLEQQQYSTQVIARMLGVAAYLMDADTKGSTLVYTNVQDARNDQLTFGTSHLTQEIEAAFSDLLPRGRNAKFDWAGILRASTQARYEAYSAGIAAGFLTVDEVRATENLPALAPTAALDAPAPTAPTDPTGTPNA